MSLMQDLGSYLGSKNKDLLGNLVSASGFTTKAVDEDRYQETNTPNVLVDTVGDDYVIDGVLYSQLGEELVTNGDFSDGTTGWTTARGASARVDNDRYYLKNGASLTSGASFTRISTTIGKMYKVRFNGCSTNDGTSFSFQVRTAGNYSGDILYNLGNGGSTPKDFEFTFIATTTTTYPHMVIYGGSYSTTELSYDNISVKELKTITKPLAPFDPLANDELLDDKVHGLVCQQAHDKADIVVTGNELVTNGTFDSDISGWTSTNAVITHENGGIRVDDSANAGPYSSARTNINVISGIKYIFEYSSQSGTGDTQISLYSGADNTTPTNGDLIGYTDTSRSGTGGSYTYEWISTYTGTATLSLGCPGTDYVIYDNISVKLADNVYQATRDTADMYDYELNTSTYIEVLEGKVYLADGTITNSTAGHYYLRTAPSATVGVPTTAWTVNSHPDWLDLGTASNMDLRNPYFQVLEDVTRHDIIAMSSKGYKTYKGIKHYYDTEIIDGSHDLIASDRGWTKIGNNTYIDEDGEKVFIVEVVPTLNAGAYHPDFNAFGCIRYAREGYEGSTNGNFSNRWDENLAVDVVPTVYAHFSKSPNGVLHATTDTAFTSTNGGVQFGRPDGKFYDKFYTEAENGLLGLGYAYCFDNIDLEIDKNRLKDYIQSGVEMVTPEWYDLGEVTRAYNSTYGYFKTQNTTGGTNNYFWYEKVSVVGDNGNVLTIVPDEFGYIDKQNDGDFFIWVLSSSYGNRAKIVENMTTFIANTDTDISNAFPVGTRLTVIGYKKSKTHLTGGSKLSVKVYGDPSDYPAFMKNTLASGKSIHIEPVLVSE